MSKSQFVLNLDAIQAAVHSFLKPLSFRKKGRSYNRGTEGGLVHVINFQMGQFPIGDDYVIPGFRESFYGKVAVNLGVFLPYIDEVERQRARPDFVHEYDCTIRKRLGVLAFGEDKWFEITDDTASLASTIVELLDRFGLDFFEQFNSYKDIVAYYNEYGDLPFQNASRASLEVALIAFHIGDEKLSNALFEKAHTSDHKGFRDHVAELEKRVRHMSNLRAQKN